ncbi:MAG: hypothetical protein ACRCTA_02615 [Bacilli bacterium]
MNKEELINYLNTMYIKINEEQLNEILANASEVESIIALFDEYEPISEIESVYPFDVVTTYLREDEANHHLAFEEVLKNTHAVVDTYIKYSKVV